MQADINQIREVVAEKSDFVQKLKNEVFKVIVGQETMIDRILIAILTGGHILIEGVPGLAKTSAIKAVSDSLHTTFHRIQFTPDLLPADLIGTMHAVSTLILRGRQSKLQSHEDAVRLRESLEHAMLIEPEDCGDFPAKDNPDAAAAALNLFMTGMGESGAPADNYSGSGPVEPGF